MTGSEKMSPDSCLLPIGADRDADASSGEFRFKSVRYKICLPGGLPSAKSYTPSEIFFSDDLSTQNVFMINNLGVSFMGNFVTGVPANIPQGQNNKWITNNSDGNDIFEDQGNADFRIKDGAVSGIIDAGKSVADGAPLGRHRL